jgi:hypothetical protein
LSSSLSNSDCKKNNLAASLGKAKEGAFGMDIKENFEYLSNIDINKIDKIGNNLVNSGDITQEEFTNLKIKF